VLPYLRDEYIISIMSNKNIFIKCECDTEGVFICYDDQTDLFDMSFMSAHPDSFTISWMERVKNAFRLLFTGRLYHDQLVISPEQAKKMVNFLLDNNVHQETIHTYTVDDNAQEEGSKQRG
jgi:hypothetical protein